MFDKFKDLAGQIQMMQRLMKNENFRALMAHPKMQELLRDPEFQEIIKSKNTAQLMSHPKLASLMRDPELAPLLAKLNPQTLFG